MSTHTIPRPAPTTAVVPAGTGGRLRRAVASEWIKLRSVRSTAYVLGVVVLGIVLMAALAAFGTVADDNGVDALEIGPLGGALAGIPLAELAVAVLGVLAVTGEYGSGLVRVTFAATPLRWPVVVAKGVVVAGVVFVSTLLAVVAAYAASALVLATEGIPTSLTAPGALRALLAGPAYLTGIAVLGVGFGWLVRSTAGALAVLFVVLYVLPVVGFVLPGAVAAVVVPLLPGNAGNAMMQLNAGELLAPGTGAAVFAAYQVVTLAAASFALRRRDA